MEKDELGRRERLIRLHLALLAIAAALCVMAASRHAPPRDTAAAASAPASFTQAEIRPAPRSAGPTINWGGQRR
ncbi:MAG TPA: hypothetical protein VFA50_01845 [Stellaceae bacterium]|nr:hypothetical protein [Stellaceae bacterium]